MELFGNEKPKKVTPVTDKLLQKKVQTLPQKNELTTKPERINKTEKEIEREETLAKLRRIESLRNERSLLLAVESKRKGNLSDFEKYYANYLEKKSYSINAIETLCLSYTKLSGIRCTYDRAKEKLELGT